MKKILGFVAVLAMLVSAPAAMAGQEKYYSLNSSADSTHVSFSEDGCVLTRVSLSADDDVRDQKNATKISHEIVSSVYVSIQRYSVCWPFQYHIYVSYWSGINLQDFGLSKNLKTADLKTGVWIFDYVSWSYKYVEIDMTWTGTGKVGGGAYNWADPDYNLQRQSYKGKFLRGKATGTVLMDGENLTPGDSESAATSRGTSTLIMRVD
ncbi:hypothetical protein HYS99_01120 [Candidatus Giovannonibacteria bacterium]|nr:hypothetical protein [Candidatus Giovannonibacteria bacterium]